MQIRPAKRYIKKQMNQRLMWLFIGIRKTMIKTNNATFVKSIIDWKSKPKPALPEIAFVGRSNVGKSSLINCLVNRKNFAKVSKKPGKTQTINFFNIDDTFYLVDLPGYGFARRSQMLKADWKTGIENYLLNSAELLILMVLIDSKVGVKETDIQLIEWLDYHQIPFQIVATKVDQISRSQIGSQEEGIRETLELPPSYPILFFSAKNRTGRQELLKLINNLLNQLN